MKRALTLLFILSLMWSEEKTADQKLPDAVQAVRTFHERIAVGAMEDAYKLILGSAQFTDEQRERTLMRLKNIKEKRGTDGDISGHATNEHVAVVFVNDPGKDESTRDPIYLKLDADKKWKIVPGISRYESRGFPFDKADSELFEKLPMANK